ncbi:hypothetical protein ACH4E7_45425 [Kitasatospora sp. NPDC018058]|uniref:hypothetical protein n=1 Tax=Kitasatospora sp. NPDC018058 TaxID=3364025 RepID=UPI0037C0F963
MPRLKIPTCRTENPAPISQHRRITLIRRVLTDEELLLADRVAAALVLLYAQPISRLVRLTTSDIVRNGSQVMLRLGDPATPVPEPFAGMLLEHLAAQPNSTWLFPGHRAGQPLDPSTLRGRLAAAGIPALHGRTAAMRQLVLQAPPSVVAGMLGYHSVHAEAIAAEVGGTWKHYAPGDHSR